MIASIRYNKNAGNAAIYSRLRNVTGLFWNFSTLAWVTPEVTACRVYLSEIQDSDPAESLYAADVLIPTGGPWIIEAVLAVTGACMGGEATPPDVPTAPDNATLQALRTDFTTARATKLDNLDASLSTRATESTAQAILVESQSHPTLGEIEATTVLAKSADIPAANTIAAAVWGAGSRTLTSFGTLIADIWGYVTRTVTSGGGGATLPEIEASTVLAKQATVNTVANGIADIQTGINLVLTEVGTLLDIGQGKWEIVNNQMVFYKKTGAELMRFNLQNKSGVGSETEIFKRIPV